MKNKVSKTNTGKFFKKNFAILLSLAVIVSVLTLFIFSGYKSQSYLPYDFVVAVRAKTDLNYVRGSGGVTRETSSIIRGFTSVTISDDTSLKLLDDPNVWTTPEALEYRENLFKIAEDPLDYEKYPQAHPLIKYDTYSQSGQSLDSNFTLSDLDPTVPKAKMPPQLRMELAETIVTSSNPIANTVHQASTRIYMKDKNIDGEDLVWSSGNRILMSDFTYGLKAVGTTQNIAASQYMYDVARLSGFQEWILKQKVDDLSILESYAYFDQHVAWNVDDPSEGNKIGAAIWYSNTEKWIQYNFLTSGAETYFLSMLTSPAFMPVDEKFVNEKLNGAIFNLGLSASSLSTYGPMNVTSFDPNYGIEFVKNSNYYYKDIISINTMFHRVIREPTTAVTQFNAKRVSQIYGSELASSLYALDPTTAYWNDSQYAPPTSSYILFNLNPISNYSQNGFSSNNPLYYKNPNFRRTISAAYNRSSYYNFIQNSKGLPSGQVTADRIGVFNDLDGTANTSIYIEDALKQLSYHQFDPTNPNVPIIQTNNMVKNPYVDNPFPGLEPSLPTTFASYNYQDRMGALSGQVTRTENYLDDFLLSSNAALNYWEAFKQDMRDINRAVTSKISIAFKTQKGDADEIIQSINQSLSDLGISNELEIIPVRITNPINEFYASSFEMMSISWNPDYISYWTSQSVFNQIEVPISSNISSGWTYWEGSKQSLGFIDGLNEMSNPTYAAPDIDKTTLANWANDGLKYTEVSAGGKVNPLRVSELFPTVNIQIPNTTNTMTIDLAQEFEELKVWSNAVRPSNQNISDSNSLYTKVYGVSETELEKLSQEKQFIYALIFEILAKDSGGAMVYRNAFPEFNPSRSAFISNPIMGYAVLAYGYDSLFPPIIGMPTADDILRARGTI